MSDIIFALKSRKTNFPLKIGKRCKTRYKYIIIDMELRMDKDALQICRAYPGAGT